MCVYLYMYIQTHTRAYVYKYVRMNVTTCNSMRKYPRVNATVDHVRTVCHFHWLVFRSSHPLWWFHDSPISFFPRFSIRVEKDHPWGKKKNPPDQSIIFVWCRLERKCDTRMDEFVVFENQAKSKPDLHRKKPYRICILLSFVYRYKTFARFQSYDFEILRTFYFRRTFSRTLPIHIFQLHAMYNRLKLSVSFCNKF